MGGWDEPAGEESQAGVEGGEAPDARSPRPCEQAGVRWDPRPHTAGHPPWGWTSGDFSSSITHPSVCMWYTGMPYFPIFIQGPFIPFPGFVGQQLGCGDPQQRRDPLRKVWATAVKGQGGWAVGVRASPLTREAEAGLCSEQRC